MPQQVVPRPTAAVAQRVCVIVVTYNGRQWLDKCIGGLLGHGLQGADGSDRHGPQNSGGPQGSGIYTDRRLEVVVIDNNSSDGTPDIIRQKWPDVKLIEPGENLGFGRANNIGLRHALDAGCDYAYLLNQDAWIDPADIFMMAELQSKHPEYGILSPMQMQADLVTPDKNFDWCCDEAKCPGYKSDVSSGKPPKDIYTVRKVMAAHWLVSADAVRRIGGFAPIFTHYGEDYNFIDRLLFHGLETGICPAVMAVHDRADRPADTSLNKVIFMTYNAIFLHIACDITRSGYTALRNAFKIILKSSFMQAKEYKSLRPLANVAKAVANISRIMATRRETKIPGMHYL